MSFKDKNLPRYRADAIVHFQNAERLREGAIPSGLLQAQKTFLTSLESDRTVSSDYRADRYRRIADGEESLGRGAEKAAQYSAELCDYFAKLAAKYEKALKAPWKPVEPDPPRPVQEP